jgi:hypothetical protein
MFVPITFSLVKLILLSLYNGLLSFHNFDLNSLLFYISIVTTASFWFPVSRNTFSQPFTFTPYESLRLK